MNSTLPLRKEKKSGGGEQKINFTSQREWVAEHTQVFFMD